MVHRACSSPSLAPGALREPMALLSLDQLSPLGEDTCIARHSLSLPTLWVEQMEHKDSEPSYRQTLLEQGRDPPRSNHMVKDTEQLQLHSHQTAKGTFPVLLCGHWHKRILS